MDDYRIPAPNSLRQLYYRRRAVTLSESDDDMVRLMGQCQTGGKNYPKQAKRPLVVTKSYTGNTEDFSRGHRSVMLSISDSFQSRPVVPKTRNSASPSIWQPNLMELSSPRISPVPWLLRRCFSNQDGGGGVIGEYRTDGRLNSTDDTQRLIDPASSKSSQGGTPESDFSLSEAGSDEDEETSQHQQQHRERRKAIFDSKSLCITSPLEDSSFSPQEDSGEEAETSAATLAERPRRRKKSSADLGIHYPGDLLSQARPRRMGRPLNSRNTIADFANTKAYQASTASLISAGEQDRKVKTSFSILKLIDKKSHRPKDSFPELTETLQNLKRSEFEDNFLTSFKGAHWCDLMEKVQGEENGSAVDISDLERKRREAVWELFTSEYVFLVDHLMALKHCFMEPLKRVQVEGHLMFAEPQDLFGNLDEVCSVSYTFCREFNVLLLNETSFVRFGSNDVLIQGLKRFCQLTRDGEVYHDYCLNYSKAMTYLEQLRKNDDFVEFEKWCELDPRCNRLLLTDLLISPMQHCTKVPLLLNNICKYTENPDEQTKLMEALQQLETSLKNLEAKMNWLKNFERIQEIQQQIVWMSISELEPRAFIPEFLKPILNRQPCERILASPKRQLVYEGPLVLIEVSKTIDMYMFLFDDILLLTKIKKPLRKVKPSSGEPSTYMQVKCSTEGAIFTVYRQPIALDRFYVHDIRQSESAAVNCLRNAFVLVQITRFQQVIGVYTLQAPSESAKAAWMTRLPEAQERYRRRHKPSNDTTEHVTGSSAEFNDETSAKQTHASTSSSTPGSPRSPRHGSTSRVGTASGGRPGSLESPRQLWVDGQCPVFDYTHVVPPSPSDTEENFGEEDPFSISRQVLCGSDTNSLASWSTGLVPPRSLSHYLTPPQIQDHYTMRNSREGHDSLDRYRAKSLKIRHSPNLHTIREKSQSIDTLHK